MEGQKFDQDKPDISILSPYLKKVNWQKTRNVQKMHIRRYPGNILYTKPILKHL